MYSSSASVSWSAQCRSSRTSTQATCGARTRSRRSTASPRKIGDSSPGTGCGGRHSGISRPSTGRNGPSSSLGGRRPARPAEVSASANGRNGVGAPPATARPARTVRPRSPAVRATSRTSRDLPMPASPARNTVLPRPAPAAARAARSRRASSSRPTRTGHSTCGTGSVSARRPGWA